MTQTSRVAVVTGGANGIGRAVVGRLLGSGHTVVAFDWDEHGLETLAGEHDGGAESLLCHPGDVSDPGHWAELVERTHDRFGGIGVLVNNAAISPKRDGARIASHEMPIDEWEAVMRVNLTGAFLGFQAVVADMSAARWGRIINMSSGAARMGARVAGVHYGASKAGLLGLTRTLAVEYGSSGITVNAITPGRIETPMAQAVSTEVNAGFLAQIPVGRLGLPEDIAGMVGFLASDDASFITGATFDVNGGGYIG